MSGLDTIGASPSSPPNAEGPPPLKDQTLNSLADIANVAQFVSFDPGLSQRHCRIRGFSPAHRFESLESAVSALIHAGADGSANVRSFGAEQSKSRRFIYGLRSTHEVIDVVRTLAAEGLYTIINETIDVADGGVSGVVLGDTLEFAPGDTPRCVEKPGSCSLPREVGVALLQKVYGFKPALHFEAGLRVEFSIHPLRRGVRNEHTIIWEVENVGSHYLQPGIEWPNLFSRFIGDKAFGLLLADTLGLPVPVTTVIARAVAPFSFGRPTGTGETWIRTCPVEQVPGKFTTQRGWRDPFTLLTEEDPSGTVLSSVLAQEGVDPQYSGALIATANREPIIEGIRGRGDEFMSGRVGPQPLPQRVIEAVTALYQLASSHLGAVRFEWVYDGTQPWIVQLHRGAVATTGRTIFPGEADHYHRFDVPSGIEALRTLISRVEGTGDGIVVVGEVGVTSHLGDLLRRAKIPSRIEPQPDL